MGKKNYGKFLAKTHKKWRQVITLNCLQLCNGCKAFIFLARPARLVRATCGFEVLEKIKEIRIISNLQTQ